MSISNKDEANDSQSSKENHVDPRSLKAIQKLIANDRDERPADDVSAINDPNTVNYKPKNHNETSNEINQQQQSSVPMINQTKLSSLEERYLRNNYILSKLQQQRKSSDDIKEESKSIGNFSTVSPELIDQFNEYLKLKLNDPNNNQEIKFPVDKLAKLEDMINKPRWIIPVLPKDELETLLIVALDLAKKGLDVDYTPCIKFYRESLIVSFTKILCDDAVTCWKSMIHKCIFRNCKHLIELCALKILSDDYSVMLELLALVFNPNNKFHTHNANEIAFPSDFLNDNPTSNSSNNENNDLDENMDDESESTNRSKNENSEPIYATSKCADLPRLWLVELIEDFGQFGGFEKIQIQFANFMKSGTLSVALILALIKPFGLCYEYLTEYTVSTHFRQIIEEIPKFLENLSDNELKKESKSENKNDQITIIIKGLKNLVHRLEESEQYLERLEILRLKLILKLLKISSFNGKMNALNEINKVIGSVDFYAQNIPTVHNLNMNNNQDHQEEQSLNSKRVAQWIKENQVLQIVLKDSLHQPQYVEKLEKIIRFIIKEKQLTLQDLDDLWAAQCGKYEAIVKNMHDLLAKLAWDFTAEQLDHLFECFQNSWATASKKQREKLLELIRTLAEDDKDNIMAHKVLNLLWSLAHSSDLPTEIMDQALAAHIKILDYSCCQDRDTQKSEWLNRCIEELTRDNSDPNWVIPALKQIREICCLYHTSNVQSMGSHQRVGMNRIDVIAKLQNEHNLVEIISRNLQAFMEKAREEWKEDPNLNPNKLYGNRRYTHVQEIKERLSFLRFLLKEGHLWLCEPQAIQIWNCLVQNSVCKEDREEAFSWFSQLMTDEPDLDPELNRAFFENQILKLDPVLLTQSGIECFDKFFKVVNCKEKKIIYYNNNYFTKNLDLIGLDYLTRIVLNGIDEVSDLAIELLKAIYSNLSNCLQINKMSIIEEFILSCMDRLKSFYEVIQVLEAEDVNNESEQQSKEKQQELVKMTRILKLLYEYLNQCDLNYGDERIYLPMLRSFRGKNVAILIHHQNRNVDDVMIETHSNETLLNVKKLYLNKLKMSNTNVQVDFYLNGEHLDQDLNRDKKLVSHLTTKDNFVLTARISKSNFNSMNDNESFSSQNNSSQLIDNNNINQFRFENGLNEEAENCLPSVYMSNYPPLYKSLFNFADLGLKLKYKPIYINSLEILKLMPIDKSTSDSLIQLCKCNINSQEISQLKEQLFSANSPTKLCYTLGVIYSLLMPANINPLSDEALEFQVNFIKSGVALEVQKFITKKDFLDNADDLTKVCAYSIILKISKFVLKTIASYLVQSCIHKQNDQFRNLPKFLEYLQNSNEDFIICQSARKTASTLINQIKQQKLNQNFEVNDFIPSFEIINFVVHFIWSTASGKEGEAIPNEQSIENLHQAILDLKSDSESTTIYNICKQGLEVLTIMFMLSPSVFLKLIEDKKWESFTMDLILFSPEKSVRLVACEQFAFISTMCSAESDVLKYYINFLNQHLDTTIPKNHKNSSEFFQLYCKLLNNACNKKLQLPEIRKYLHYEIDLLKNVKKRLLVDGLIEEIQLEGHLCLIKELVMMLNSDEKYRIGCKLISDDLNSTDDEQFDGLLVMLVDEYIFTASRVMVAQQKLSQRNILGSSMQSDSLMNRHNHNNSSNSPYNSLSCIYSGDVDAICQNSATLEAAFDLIVALCIGCVPNLRYICNSLIEMFYLDHEICITEWEYQPSIGCRPLKGFVGLKNASATCYMNSVIQQLYMIPEIRDGLLSVEGAIDDTQVEFYDDDNTMNLPMNYINNNNDQQDEKKDYNVGVVKHVQAIFGHLTLNKLQYYIPKGFWFHFKLWGEQINLREQHDALEFFNSLVDSIDEGLKKLSYNKLMASVLGGSFADQKICKDCPHRYEREESFTTLNIDIRNHSNLLDSLEQYVKGDLLEGANAYHCEKCNRKVNTVKRLCIKKLPIILTIQLKRFDYDWERGCAIKFNDYFEFPRLIDMEPYTVDGLAKIEGEIIEDIIEQENINLEIEVNENSNSEFKENINNNSNTGVQCTKYELCGIVVHSGQASGGHYYSYILYKDTDGVKKWYKFDDGEVSECKLDQDEEMKNQCFGGDYLGEVFDHMMKRMSCRKQKRWWSAYILFYRRVDTEQCQFSLRLNELVLSNANINNSNLIRASSNSALIKQNSGDSEHQRRIVDTNVNELYMRIPTPIRRSVQRQNIKFMHMRNQFNPEYFNFIKNLTSSNHEQLLNQFSNFSSNENNSRDENSLRENCSKELINRSSPTTTATIQDQQLIAKQQVEISLYCTKLLAKFLFTTCFHTKKVLRGSTNEWYEILTMHLRSSPMIRGWFAHSILIDHTCRFSEYLLECTSGEIRNVFGKLVMFIAHYALLDGNSCQLEIELDDGTRDIVQCGQPLSDYIMQLVIDLLKRETMDRHMNQNYNFNQYFNLFYQYCNTSREARAQLIKLGVASRFIMVAQDENVIPSLKSQFSEYREFGRLHQVVSILVRSCDVSSKCQPYKDGQILPNPYSFDNDSYICSLPLDTADQLFNKQNYVKKVIEEATNLDETFMFLKFCCWENPRFSLLVLEELIWHVAFYYDNELKPHLDILLHILMMQDSWQRVRIVNALNGTSSTEKKGVLDTINRDTIQHQKRAYQCIKFLVNLFTNCEIALMILENDTDIRNKYIAAVTWLNDELNNSSAINNQLYNWSSNEGSNSYRLFRSNSSRITLSKAINLCPKEEAKDKSDDEEMSQQNQSDERVIENEQISDESKENDNNVATVEFDKKVSNINNKEDKPTESERIINMIVDDLINKTTSTSDQKGFYKLSEI